MLDDINFLRLISFTISWMLLLLSLWGVIAFFPRKSERNDTGGAWLILAIWMTFLGVALNAAYWRVFGDIVLYFEWFTVPQVRAFGNTIGDTIWKGCGAIGAYLHFYSRWKFLKPEERPNWTPLLMGFYPDETHWAVRSARRIQQLGVGKPRKQKEE